VSRGAITIAYVTRLLQDAAREGVDAGSLFREAGLDARLLEQPEARIATHEFIRLMQIVMRRTEDEFIGLGRGTKSKPGTFSMMAHAVINCPNLGHAIERSAQFYRIVDLPIELRLEEGATESRFILTTEAPERDNILEAMIFIMVRFWSWLTGRTLEPISIQLDFPEPPQADEFRKIFRGPVTYNNARNAIVFPTPWLSLPLVQNPLSLSKFLRDSLALIIVGNQRPIGLTEQIKAIISKGYGNSFPDFAQVCDSLNMTPQTLRRRLKEENTSYQAIKDNIRQDAARYYLAKEELSIDEIALMMGFSEASSFHRAFKKWTGQTPAGYRRELLGLPPESDDDEEGWVTG
jgi:AraC-like DNA-binding protein